MLSYLPMRMTVAIDREELYTLYAEQRRQEERRQLERLIVTQVELPSSRAAFKNHPVYVLEGDLLQNEVLAEEQARRPGGSTSKLMGDDATSNLEMTGFVSACPAIPGKSSCRGTAPVHSYFKGERVYLRQHIERIYSRRDWFKQLRCIDPSQLDLPVKTIRRYVQKQYRSTSGQSGDGSEGDGSYREIRLYRRSQTEECKVCVALISNIIVPCMLHTYIAIHRRCIRFLIAVLSVYVCTQVAPVGPDDTIPVNSYGNVTIWDHNEGLVPSGAVYIRHVDAVKICINFGLHHSPAVVGFETKYDGHKVPIIGGVVVLKADASLVRDALENICEYKDGIKRRKVEEKVVDKWRRLVIALLTRQRLKLTYGH